MLLDPEWLEAGRFGGIFYQICPPHTYFRTYFFGSQNASPKAA
jgi:hypothetical protein